MDLSFLTRFIIFFKPIPTQKIDIPMDRLGNVLTTMRLGFLKEKTKSWNEWNCVPLPIPLTIDHSHIGYETGAFAQLEESSYKLPAFVKDDKAKDPNLKTVRKPQNALYTGNNFVVARDTLGFKRTFRLDFENRYRNDVILSFVELLLTTNFRQAEQTSVPSLQRTGLKAFIFNGVKVPDFLTLESYSKGVDAEGNTSVELNFAIPQIVGTDEEVQKSLNNLSQQHTGVANTAPKA